MIQGRRVILYAAALLLLVHDRPHSVTEAMDVRVAAVPVLDRDHVWKAAAATTTKRSTSMAPFVRFVDRR